MAKHRSKSFLNLRTIKHRLLSLAVVLVVLVGGVLAYSRFKDNPPASTTSGDKSGQESKGNPSPPTAEEKQAGDTRKNQIVDEQKDQASSQNSSTKNVSVVITGATSTDVRGYTSGVFEDGGTCTATATKGSQAIIKTSAGSKNVSYTSCSPIYWDSPLGNGSWTINLSYKSTTAQGSASQTIEVK